ncbi:hypothetical protein [Streptomyces melanogenes]|uniref:hypothetical protein n=1 Tax=Streptomyces melanogenes TaxID=67326 RepID=UPI00379CFE1E
MPVVYRPASQTVAASHCGYGLGTQTAFEEPLARALPGVSLHAELLLTLLPLLETLAADVLLVDAASALAGMVSWTGHSHWSAVGAYTQSA